MGYVAWVVLIAIFILAAIALHSRINGLIDEEFGGDE